MRVWKPLMGAVISFRKRYCGFILLILLFFFFVILHYNVVYNQMQSSYFSNDGTVITVPGWELNKSRNVSDYIFPDDITTIITSRSICSSKYPPRILLIICSGTENFLSRSAIRKTWAQSAYEKFNISVVFLMGVSLDEEINERIKHESEVHNDVIVEDFIDTYNNLTVKTLMLLKWVKNNCNNTSYIMKTDDDVYINMNNLIQLIDSLPEHKTRNVLLGKLLCGSAPISNPNNKWYMPSYMYPYKVYPYYLSGVGYLMSLQVALRLYEEAFSIPIIHMEDVYITGLCARRAGIRPARQFMFQYHELTNVVCSMEDDYLIVHSHQVSYDDMYHIHNKLVACKTPENRTSVFNWFFLRTFSGSRRKINPKFDVHSSESYSYTCK